MKRARLKTLRLMGNNLRVSIPLYAEDPVGLDHLPSSPLESYQGPHEFNHVLIHFGDFFKNLHQQEINSKNLPLIVPQNHNEIDELAARTTAYVKEFSRSKRIDVQKARKYRQSLLQLACHVKGTLGGPHQFAYTFVPLRGGAHVVSAFAVDYDSMIAIDCKRIPLENGTFAFGMHSPVFDPYDLDRIKGKKIRVIEVCVASGITSVGILTDLLSKGCLPEEVHFQVLFASQKGMSIIRDVCNEIGTKVKFYVGKVYTGLGNLVLSHDSIIDDAGRPVIGDATRILEVASANYNPMRK